MCYARLGINPRSGMYFAMRRKSREIFMSPPCTLTNDSSFRLVGVLSTSEKTASIIPSAICA